MKRSFAQELKRQRWDDHRLYHHSRVNQSFHLMSALTFLCAYVMCFIDPVIAAFLGWIVAMCPRQIGHFFFEPKGFDEVNGVTHDYKEEIKVGYNLNRKIVLLSIWGAIPLLLLASPSLFGIFEPYATTREYLWNLSISWLFLGAGAILFRTVHLFFLQDVLTGLAWATKILTDPFHDVMLYHKSPIYLLRGELIDPMYEVELARSSGTTGTR